jgi:crotonobetainyl-CoA:carnitine CoA-transferase CaiB-like acyl-CoA transferase
MSGPLEGLRIIEIGEGPAVAHAGRNLADMGAEVVKIEPPEGDGMRRWPSVEIEGAPAVFHALNRGKASLVLNLADPAERKTLAALLKAADGVIDGSPHGLARALAPERDAPGLVVARITPYGDDVATDVPAHDATLQAESGWMSTNGRGDEPAVRSGLPMPSQAAGASAVQAMLAALIAREEDGEGEDIDVALYDQALIISYHYAMQFMINGNRPLRFGNGSPAASPLGVFEASDGQFQMTAAGDRVWKRLVENVLEMPELLEDPRFDGNSARVVNVDDLMGIIVPLFKTQPRAHWIAKMQGGGVPGGPIRNLDEAVAAPESVERGLVVSAEQGGGVPSIRNPMRFRDTPLADPKPGPMLGRGGPETVAKWSQK